MAYGPDEANISISSYRSITGGRVVLGKLAARFLADELHDGVVTQILPLPVEAVDMNLACHWLLVVMPDEVRRFDADWIHDHVSAEASSNGSQNSYESQDFKSALTRQIPQWTDISPTARTLQPAA